MGVERTTLIGNLECRTWYVVKLCVPLSCNPFLWIYDMNTRRAAARIVEDGLDNEGDTPIDNQVPQQEQASIILPPMTDREIRSAFFTLTQAMTTKLKQ